jgi:hypothetical protein
VSGGTGIASGAYYAGDRTGYRWLWKYELAQVQQSAEQANLAILQIQFQILDQKRQQGKLTFLELQQYCSAARQLGYVHVPDCGF